MTFISLFLAFCSFLRFIINGRLIRHGVEFSMTTILSRSNLDAGRCLVPSIHIQNSGSITLWLCFFPSHRMVNMKTGAYHTQNTKMSTSLLWRHNGRDSVSNHQPHDCLLKRLFRRRSKKTSKLRVTGLVRGIDRWPVNSPHKKIFFLHLMTSSCIKAYCDIHLRSVRSGKWNRKMRKIIFCVCVRCEGFLVRIFCWRSLLGCTRCLRVLQ